MNDTSDKLHPVPYQAPIGRVYHLGGADEEGNYPPEGEVFVQLVMKVEDARRCTFGKPHAVISRDHWVTLQRAVRFVRKYRDAEREGVEESLAHSLRPEANAILSALGEAPGEPEPATKETGRITAEEMGTLSREQPQAGQRAAYTNVVAAAQRWRDSFRQDGKTDKADAMDSFALMVANVCVEPDRPEGASE